MKCSPKGDLRGFDLLKTLWVLLELRQSILKWQNLFSPQNQKPAVQQMLGGSGTLEREWRFGFTGVTSYSVMWGFSTTQFAEHLWHCDPSFIKSLSGVRGDNVSLSWQAHSIESWWQNEFERKAENKEGAGLSWVEQQQVDRPKSEKAFYLTGYWLPKRILEEMDATRSSNPSSPIPCPSFLSTLDIVWNRNAFEVLKKKCRSMEWRIKNWRCKTKQFPPNSSLYYLQYQRVVQWLALIPHSKK